MTRNDYLKELKRLDFYKDDMYPELVPFVGDDYPKYRILHIGESHYIPNRTEDYTDKYGSFHKANEVDLEDFSEWWNGEVYGRLADFKGWYNTADVINWYMSGERRKGHGIFTNTLRSFCKIVVPEEEFKYITTENSKKYNYFAFMNFFQMPSVYEGKSFWKSIYKSADIIGKPELAGEVWNKAVEESVNIVDSVIDVLNPKAVVFTSISAGKTYKESKGKYSDDKRIIYTSHPQSSLSWNKELKSLDYKKGIDVFETELKRIYK